MNLQHIRTTKFAMPMEILYVEGTKVKVYSQYEFTSVLISA
ncbi:hypothetical protein NZ698_01225 [Chryseobacterium sp. PBS4-4]|uniref:Uncharacterized protein n=1 Tax=Chryseobacterium edaphi TaxID=2976532 RepID=A0ABT2W0M9_9FLAO|nr:hypothetical protein [Chryseobacterium edaphi]MCU7615805.1 hypothetical protein [Chryseobacterium edaphi]